MDSTHNTPVFHGTTILSVRRQTPQGMQVAIGGDGQVTLGNIVVKGTARKVRKLYHGKVLAGFAGATADAFTLFERFEAKLEKHQGHLTRAAIELTKPGTLDARVYIIECDVRSRGRLGHWPWSRTRGAARVRYLLERQQVAALGMDVVFAEPDGSSGLQHLQQLAREELRGNAAFADWLARTAPTLDYDGVLAAALQSGPVALGYYFSSDRDARRSGTLPRPLAQVDALPPGMLQWDGYGGNIAPLTAAARVEGHLQQLRAAAQHDRRHRATRHAADAAHLQRRLAPPQAQHGQ